jgi:hypothetical protein
VDWRSDIHNIKKLVKETDPEEWDSLWFHFNFNESGRRDWKSKQEAGLQFGHNQTVAVHRKTWMDKVGHFPLYCDYGSDDPWVANKRGNRGYTDFTLWEHEAYHQWHATMQYWIALGKAPNWNRHGHTTSNVADDPIVPDGGTCEIWDGGDTASFSEKETEAEILALRDLVYATGFRPKESGEEPQS